MACVSASASPSAEIYAGGVAGVEALAHPDSSAKFRKSGGGLYIHNNGWEALSRAQQKEVLANFQDLPVAIELGFNKDPGAWADRLRTGYLELGIKPAFIAANAFSSNRKPKPEQWIAYSQALRDAGLPATTLILPTFEYANFQGNLPTLASNKVSQRKDFQDIITAAGGLVLDSPPAFAFNREENYRSWVVDAIQWARKHGYQVVWITSPHISPRTFREDTERFLIYLQSRGASPTIIVSENYEPHAPPNYPSVVGHEDSPETTLGVAWELLKNKPKP